MIIGITGYAQSGKDTAGNYLVDKYGFRKFAYAETLKEFVYEMDPVVNQFRYRELIDILGLDEAKVAHPEVRRLLQSAGVAARKLFGEDFWVKQCLHEINKAPKGTRAVITDVRFQNETNPCDFLFRVEREGVGPVNNHISEKPIEGGRVIRNDGTIEEFYEEIEKAIDGSGILSLALRQGRRS
jgi:dephospho-CoA kinase